MKILYLFYSNFW